MKWNDYVFAVYTWVQFWSCKLYTRMPIMRFMQKWRAEAAILLVSAGAGNASWDCCTELTVRRDFSKVHDSKVIT